MKKIVIINSLCLLVCSSFVDSYAANRNSSTDKKTVRVLTLNTGLMSVFFGTISIGLKNNKERAKLLGETIKDMGVLQPDVIAFQEAFDRKRLLSEFYGQLKNIYPYTYFDSRLAAYLGGVDSGLAIFSKYPITKKMIKDYDCWAGVEALARKGIMGVKINVDGCPFYLFNTHLQAGVDRQWYIRAFGLRPRSCEGKSPGKLSSSEIVQIELRQAKREIEKFVETKDYFNLTAPILLVGDLNISRIRDEEDYEVLLETFPAVLDTYYNGSQKVKSSSWDKGKVADSQTDRVDYALLLNPIPGIDAQSNIIKNFTADMTDHLGVLVELSFTCEK